MNESRYQIDRDITNEVLAKFMYVFILSFVMAAIVITYMGVLHHYWSHYCMHYTNGAFPWVQVVCENQRLPCVLCFFLELWQNALIPEPAFKVDHSTQIVTAMPWNIRTLLWRTGTSLEYWNMDCWLALDAFIAKISSCLISWPPDCCQYCKSQKETCLVTFSRVEAMWRLGCFDIHRVVIFGTIG